MMVFKKNISKNIHDCFSQIIWGFETLWRLLYNLHGPIIWSVYLKGGWSDLWTIKVYIILQWTNPHARYKHSLKNYPPTLSLFKHEKILSNY